MVSRFDFLPKLDAPAWTRPEGPSSRRIAAAGAALFLLSLSAGLLFVFSGPIPKVHDDAIGYLALARNVSLGAGFTADGSTPMLYRPPLFSVLLGGWFFLTGASSVLSAAIFQSVLHALGVVAIFGLFLEISGSLAWAGGGSVLMALNPILVTRTVFVLQEPTLLLFTTLAAWLSLRLVREPATGRAALAGVSWGLCTLGKAVVWFAPILLLAMRLLPGSMRWSWRRKEAAALLFCFAATVAPWILRNYVHSGRFIPVNDQGVGVLEWNVSHAEPPGGTPGRELLEKADRDGWNSAERTRAEWSYIVEHARYFLVDRVVRNAVRFAAPARDWWIARGYARPHERRRSFWILAGLFHIPLYLFLLFRSAQWIVGRKPAWFAFPVLLYWVYWAEHALLWGDPRYGLAVYPLLVGMALPVLPIPGRTSAADVEGS